ncbi:iron-containing alcohol dehydrogenase [Nocardioides campestrisoli]|uniref:iron-containing alcohol dehydrogenase n=1 Tax=Nocardioides campestrisoli TaxID=2736757 RepID=UPI00163D909A|nr:iron-containing alcohol dehydrogenase [Nocardioides campestrisoli]
MSGRPAAPPALPDHLHVGCGAADRLVDLVEGHSATSGSRRPLVVMGSASSRTGWAKEVVARLRRRHGWELDVVVRRSHRLTVAEAERLVGAARPHSPDLVVGIGGGSVLDAAKVVAGLCRSSVTLARAVAQPSAMEHVVPLVAVPTTAGSGSEATPTATLWDGPGGAKLALDDLRLAPRLAVVDPLLGLTLPLRSLASAALDALAHGVESVWSTRSTAESRAHALHGVELVSSGLLGCLADPGDLSARSALSLGAAHSGVAIGVTRTTLAHALSYPLTARHGLSHGHACALALAPVAAFNAAVAASDCVDPRGEEFVRSRVREVLTALGVESSAGLRRLVEEVLGVVGLPTLDDVRPAVDLPAVVREAQASGRSRNNPRRVDAAALLPLLQQCAQT